VIIQLLIFTYITPDATTPLIKAIASCYTGAFIGCLALIKTLGLISTIRAAFFALEVIETSFFYSAF
jgi:hypothetical protein